MPCNRPRIFELFNRRLLLSVLLVFGGCWGVGLGSVVPVAHAAGEASELFEFTEPGAEFKIQVPPNWQVQPRVQGFALSMKPSEKAARTKLPGGVIADPSITVAVAKKPVKFNEQFLAEMAKEIEESFVRYNGPGTGFQIFQKNILSDLPGGHQALLYYVSFSTDGAPAGQAILITGNDKVRYRVTLSDHRLNFDKNLEAYFPYMVSIEFKDNAPASAPTSGFSTNDVLVWAGLIVLAGGGLGFAVRLKRSRSSGQVRSRRSSAKTSAMGRLAPTVLSEGPSSLSPRTGSFDRSVEPSNVQSAESEIPTSRDQPEQSMIPLSMIGFSTQNQESRNSADAAPPAFTAKDLSAPPQSVPLSQVVDESSAPPDMKKRWQIFNKPPK